MSTSVVDALLPPPIIAVIALGLVISGRRRAAALALVCLVLFAVEGVPHLLITPLFLPPAPPPTTAPAAIVVLASSAPELLDTSRMTPSLETLKRLRTAAALSRTTGAPILVSGARAPDGSVPVATRMAVSLETDFGVRATWTETNSTNLWQSAATTAAILRKAGVTEIFLVTQPWEARLAVTVFRAAGLVVTSAPLPYGARRPLDFTALIVLTTTWLDSALALGEWAGLACQALSPCAGWMRGGLKQDPS